MNYWSFLTHTKEGPRVYADYPKNLLALVSKVSNFLEVLLFRVGRHDRAEARLRDGTTLRIGTGWLEWRTFLNLLLMMRGGKLLDRIETSPDGEPCVVNLVNGVKFSVNSTNINDTLFLIREQFGLDCYRVKNVNFQNQIVVDVGANIGDTALLFASKGATVYSFEPLPSVFESYERNCTLNRDITSRLCGFNVGLSDHYGTVQFTYDRRKTVGVSLSNRAASNGNEITETINLVNAIDFLKSRGIDRCDLLKVDCEGCEKVLFRDKKLLDYLKPQRVIIEYHFGWFKELLAVLKGQYSVVDIAPSKQHDGFGMIYASVRMQR
ncbi:MAG: FkbM family methyltransferase [Nitrososphaerota archaeon]|nr:FkbM family methyltransferase [Nitrososphaerota archaeon]